MMTHARLAERMKANGGRLARGRGPDKKPRINANPRLDAPLEQCPVWRRVRDVGGPRLCPGTSAQMLAQHAELYGCKWDWRPL